MRNAYASPPKEHPKQCRLCLSGETINDGVFSLWNGQFALKFFPAGVSVKYVRIKSAMSSFSLISSVVEPGVPIYPVISLNIFRKQLPYLCLMIIIINYTRNSRTKIFTYFRSDFLRGAL